MAKRSWRAHLAAEAPRQLGHVALDGDVDVRPVATEQQVADGAADQIGGQPRGGLAQALDAGKRRQALAEPLGLDLRSEGVIWARLWGLRGRSLP